MSERPLAVVPAWRWWLGFLVILAIASSMTVIAYREGLPEALINPVRQFDKVVHFTLAGLLSFFLDGALKRRGLFAPCGRQVPCAAICVLVPVGIEEYMQRYAVLRTSSFADFFADVAGVVAFTMLSRRVAQ